MARHKIKFIFISTFVLIIGIFLDSSHIVSATGKGNKQKDVIVVYKNKVGKQEILDNSIDVDYQFKNVPAVSATLTENDIKQLKRDSDIAYVEENIPFTTVGEQTAPILKTSTVDTAPNQWNIKAVNAPEAWSEGYTGKGVKVAVIDTGISLHSELKVAGGYSTVDYSKSWKDDNGHGTMVAGIIAAQPGMAKVNRIDVAGVAPNAKLYSVKVLDNNGEGNLTDVLEGIDWAIQQNMDIINMSLETNQDSQLFHDLVDKAYNKGILIVGASGNQGNDYPVSFPAKYKNVIAVSAVDKYLELSTFSSIGADVDFTAPGEGVISTFLDDGYSYGSGTSFSAPHVSGMLAIMKQKYPVLSNDEIEEVLRKYIKDIGPTGRDNNFGYGLVKYSSAIDHVSDTPLDSEALGNVEKAINEIALADKSRKLWDYDSARNTINKLPLVKQKIDLQNSLKELQQKMGLVQFTSLSNIDKSQNLLVKFTLKIKKESLNANNIYVRKDGDFVQEIGREISSDGKSVIITPPEEGFQSGQTYFLYIDRSITGVTGKNLKFPVIVMFKVN